MKNKILPTITPALNEEKYTNGSRFMHEVVQEDSKFIKRTYKLVFLSCVLILGTISLFDPLGWDHLNFHYMALKNKWGLLPYKDFYNFQFIGIYIYHLLIQKLYGYSDFGLRLFDLINFVFLSFTIRYTYRSLDDNRYESDIYLILIINTISYYGLGWWWTAQREIFLLPYVFLSFYLTKQSFTGKSLNRSILAGVLSGLVFSIKPYYVAYLPVFLLIQLLFNYPIQEQFTKRVKVSLFTLLGFLLVIISYLLLLHFLGILLPFFENLSLAFDFKVNKSPFIWNMKHIIFGIHGSIFFKISNLILFVISMGFIFLVLYRKNTHRYFITILLYILSIALILYQANGEVMNHHIPYVCFRSILAALFIIEAGKYIKSYFIKSTIKFNYVSLPNTVGLIQLFISISIIIPLFLVPLNKQLYNLLKGDITLDEYYTYKQPIKTQEDILVKYVNSTIDKDKDKIFNFCFSTYTLYKTKTKSFSMVDNNSLFLMIPEKSSNRKKILKKVIDDFKKYPPKLVLIRKDDTWWRHGTSFKQWSTSYNELKKITPIWKILERDYKVVINLPSFVVVRRFNDT